MAWFFFYEEDFEARSATRIESLEAMASELDAGGVDCTLRPQEEVSDGEAWGGCADPDDPRGFTLQFAIYNDQQAYEDRLNADSVGCGGPFVFGPNWWVGPAFGSEIGAILDAVGGRPVGEDEPNNC